MNSLILFDVDNTLTESGEKISTKMIHLLQELVLKYDLGIVSGGTIEKLKYQLHSYLYLFKHIFAECGCEYFIFENKIYEKNLRNHPCSESIDKIIKYSLNFLSTVEYKLDGHLIDYRKGILYISLIGMSANNDTRQNFIKKHLHYRQELINQLKNLDVKDVEIKKGGKVGIAVYPKECDKIQVLKYLINYKKIYYFGDSYDIDGNDYRIINAKEVIGIKVNNKEETFKILSHLL